MSSICPICEGYNVVCDACLHTGPIKLKFHLVTCNNVSIDPVQLDEAMHIIYAFLDT